VKDLHNGITYLETGAGAPVRENDNEDPLSESPADEGTILRGVARVPDKPVPVPFGDIPSEAISVMKKGEPRAKSRFLAARMPV
jgi:hypothetical protein